jgi:hypothetical protein
MIRETNALARVAPIAAILSGTPGLAFSQASPFLTGATSLQTNILILRCSGSDTSGTAYFASRLIGEREIVRRQTSRGRDRDGLFALRGFRRSVSTSEQHVTEAAVMPSEIEQLPDLTGYLKTASSKVWRRVRIAR